MKKIVQIDSSFIESNTDFSELIEILKKGFTNKDIIVPLRHHHDFPNPELQSNSTLLLMPAWNSGRSAGVKIITVNPENYKIDLPSIQGTYIYLDAKKGSLKAILDAKSLTAKRTASASALASKYLSRKDSSSLLMIGTGTLSANLIKAHAAVRPIKQVYVWGRNFEKAKAVCKTLSHEIFEIIPVQNIMDKLSDVDIISCATLSKAPLIQGDYLSKGQHIDLVGSYKEDMREADNTTIKRAMVYVDIMEGALKETGDIVQPLKEGVISKNDIIGDLFNLCLNKIKGRNSNEDITVFKSVGHALEDLVAADYYYNKFINE